MSVTFLITLRDFVDATWRASMVNPSGLAVNGAVNLYVADTGNNRVLKYTPGLSGADPGDRRRSRLAVAARGPSGQPFRHQNIWFAQSVRIGDHANDGEP